MVRNINLEEERKFENANVVGSDQRQKQEKFFWSVLPKLLDYNGYVFNKIKNKTVLEIGCSNGESVKRYAKYCKKITGVDLSDRGINHAKSLNIKNAEFYLADAHSLPFEDKVFDVVIVNSMLHHLDLNLAFEQIHRVLKDDGKLYAREPLGTNPIISLYRKFTPNSRTKDERPFTFQDIKLMKKFFIFKDINFMGFFCIISSFIGSEYLRNILIQIDNIFSKTPLKYFYWQIYGEFLKR